LDQTLRDGLRYTVNAGEVGLREAIASHYAYPGLGRPENVCITTGSQEAVFVAIKTLLDPAHDELLVVEPAFPAYRKMAQLEGVAVTSVAMDAAHEFAFDPQRILGAVTARTRLIIICSPCNPTGRVISSDAVRELSAGLARRPGKPVYVLHDEIYRQQTYISNAGYFGQVYPHTIVTNSVSKSNALTGLRLGWTIAPAEIAAAIVKTHAWVTSCASTFAQRVAHAIFSTPGGIEEHRVWYRTQRDAVVGLLQKTALPHIAPEGSFYVSVALPPGISSLTAAHELAERFDVIASPGIAFGESFEGWLRLSWVSPIADVERGFQRIVTYASATAGTR